MRRKEYDARRECRQMVNLIIPVAPDRPHVTVTTQYPVTPEEWERMLIILDTMKPGLVVTIEDDTAPAKETP